MTDYVATRWYRAPELILTDRYSFPVDIWSVGCIMGELTDGQPMFPGDDTLDQLNQIVRVLGPFNDHLMGLFHSNGHLKNLHLISPDSYQTLERRYRRKGDSDGLHLMSLLLEMDPRKRITAEEALKHPYFASMHGESFGSRPIQVIQGEQAHKKEFKENYNQNKISLTNLKINDQSAKNYTTLYLKNSSNSPSNIEDKIFANTLSFLKVCHNQSPEI